MPEPRAARRPRWGQWRGALLLVLVLVVVNLPTLIGLWSQAQVRADGEDVTASVVRAEPSGSDYLVSFTYPEEITDGATEEETAYAVRVDRATGERAEETGTLDVRVRPGHPATYVVDGAVRDRSALVMPIVLNALVVLIALLLWRTRGRMRPELLLRATDAPIAGPAEPLLERVEGQSYVVQGRIASAGDGELLLEVADRRVRVLLDGHAVPAGVGEDVRVQGLMIG